MGIEPGQSAGAPFFQGAAMQVSGFLATSMPAPRAAGSVPVSPSASSRPRLADFLRSHATEILEAWDEFAATVSHDGKALDAVNLRDHAAEILLTIANDLAQPQSSRARAAAPGAATRRRPRRMRISAWSPASRWTR
jgi:hypothetical protein